MSWCNACQRGFEASTSQCPSCGRPVDVISGSSEEAGPVSPVEAERTKGPPWHFWLVIGAAVVYLGWRSLEGLAWLVRSVF